MTRLIAAFLTACVALTAVGTAGAGELRKPEIYSDFQGFALKGYDTVAYFTEGRAVKGSPAFALEWKETTWHFASAENRDIFAADPGKYVPQYGGYCAWAITKNRLAPINPEIFRVVDGKLYLNLNMKVHQEWIDAIPQMIANGDENWPDALVLAK
ncbi:MAG: YHS domain-containing (seleno)protein [Pseudomonadota bacterium]